MNNIKNTERFEGIVLSNNSEKIILTSGLHIEIVTDGTEHSKIISGVVDWATIDQVQMQDGENIPFEYIEEIKVLGKRLL